ncbi:hypothetical protein IC582_002107 [Cucumis melo]
MKMDTLHVSFSINGFLVIVDVHKLWSNHCNSSVFIFVLVVTL